MAGQSHRALAEACQVDRSTVTHWLTGRNSIGLRYLPAIAKFLHVSVADLFRDTGPRLTADEIGLITMWRLLSPDDRRHMRGLVERLAFGPQEQKKKA